MEGYYLSEKGKKKLEELEPADSGAMKLEYEESILIDSNHNNVISRSIWKLYEKLKKFKIGLFRCNCVKIPLPSLERQL